MTTLYHVKNLGIKYHTREGSLSAIRNVNFEVEAGNVVGIVGESGCGKSTIARAMMRLLSPNGEIYSGQLLFKGIDLRDIDEGQMCKFRGRDISMIFQDPLTSLNPVYSIEQQMVDAVRAHPRNQRTIGRREAFEQSVEMLDRVEIPDARNRIKEFPHHFSGGMRQRIMIAIALLSHPSLLIADEPTSALDVTLEAQIVDLISGLTDEFGMAILYITHDLGIVAQLCDRVIVMYAGNIVESGDVYSIFKTPKHPYTQALLHSHPSYSKHVARLISIPGRVPSLRELPQGCKFSPRCKLARDTCHRIEPETISVAGQYVKCHVYSPNWHEVTSPVVSELSTPSLAGTSSRSEYTESEPIVITSQLKVYFRDRIGLLGRIVGQRVGAVRAIDGVNIKVRRGETLAVVGESGSGKTTLGRTILNLECSTDGVIQVEGKDITTLSQSKVRPLRARMQMIFQDPYSSLSPRKKCSSLLLEPYKIHNIPVDPMEKVEDLLEMVGLSSEQANKYPHQLSGGQARRVGIARALALQPNLLVADEPTAGLDVSVAASVLNLLKDLKEKSELTYIIITHNLSVVYFIADRVAVMYMGKIVEMAETQSLFTNPKHPYTEALLSAIPFPDPELRNKRMRIILKGEIPNSRTPPPGCPFHPRCQYSDERCKHDVPLLNEIDHDQHLTACHFPERVQFRVV